MARHHQRKRMIGVGLVVGALLLVGPAAYGVAVATTRVDDPVDSTTQGLLGSGKGDNDDGSSKDGKSSDDDTGDGNSDGTNPDGTNSDGTGNGSKNQDGQKSGDEKDGDKNGDGDNTDNADNADNAKDEGKDKDKDKGKNGLDVLASDCSGSKLAPHDGFQKGDRCVGTAFGEVGTQNQNPSLLITSAPRSVSPGQGFQIVVSTRNLVRDRFLAAGQGGYYKETSLLNGQGLQRGHFHTACRVLSSTNEAPDAAPKPEFFLATEDGGGGSAPDTVTIDIPGVAQPGELQCSSWAGDGSHRIPMMQRADQTPAFDSVRITVG